MDGGYIILFYDKKYLCCFVGKLRGKDVAVKILHGTIGIKRFSVLEEMSRLEHRNLVKFIGLIETGLQESKYNSCIIQFTDNRYF